MFVKRCWEEEIKFWRFIAWLYDCSFAHYCRKSFKSIDTEKDRIISGNNIHMSRIMTKPTKWHMRPAKTQISLGIRPPSLIRVFAVRMKLGSLATHWAHSEDPDQTGRMPRLIWVFAGALSFCWFCHEAAHLNFCSKSLHWRQSSFFFLC